MTYILYKKEPCLMCEGEGIVQRTTYDERGPERVPVTCSVCDSTGHTLTEVDLIDVLRELGVFAGGVGKAGAGA